MARRPTSFSLRQTDDRHAEQPSAKEPRRGDPGRDRRPVQAARLRLPVVGDLRRPRAPPTTTATTASCSRTTSRPSGGERGAASATTSSPSTRRSSCIPRTWEASGHLEGFTDPMVDCRTCKLRFRADKLEDAQCGRKPSVHPGEIDECDLTEPRQFNLMFETHMGPVERRRRQGVTCGRRPRRGSSSTSRTSSSSRARSRRSGSPRSARRSATRSLPATSSSGPASSR